MSTVPAIAFEGVDKTFPASRLHPAVQAARSVSFAIQAGEVVSIIGPSGCGKSTLLNIGSGLAPPTAGVVKVLGVPVQGPNTQVAFMLQKDLI